jgi:hypothetical protein
MKAAYDYTLKLRGLVPGAAQDLAVLIPILSA